MGDNERGSSLPGSGLGFGGFKGIGVGGGSGGSCELSSSPSAHNVGAVRVRPTVSKSKNFFIVSNIKIDNAKLDAILQID